MSVTKSTIRASLLLMSLACSSSWSASSIEAPSLRQLVIQGLSLNPRVRAIEAEVEQADMRVDLSEGGYWPTLDVSAGPADGVKGDLAYNINASYTLYDWGALDSEVSSMNARAREKMHYLRQVRSEVGLEIIEAYFDSKMELQRKRLILDHQSHLENIEKMANVRSGGGYSDRSEVNRVRQAIYYSEQQWQQALSDERQAKLRLELLIQRPVNRLPTLPNFSQIQQNILPRKEDESTLIKQSPQYMQAVEKVEVAKNDASQAKAEQLPKLVLDAYSQRRKVGGDLLEDSAIAVNVRASLKQGPASFDLDDVEHLRAEAAKWDVQFTQLDMARNMGIQRETMATLEKQEGAIINQLDAATNLVLAYQDQFRAGLTTVQELLNVERERFELANQHLNVSIELLRIPYRIRAELGVLDSYFAPESYGGEY
ncbi:TolC family protein [Vibrio alginolyticus]|nr:TolC family protein [Vibrio alginolyticus]EME9804099.1 TolC family protein [Vibrio alginolyticus]